MGSGSAGERQRRLVRRWSEPPRRDECRLDGLLGNRDDTRGRATTSVTSTTPWVVEMTLVPARHDECHLNPAMGGRDDTRGRRGGSNPPPTQPQLTFGGRATSRLEPPQAPPQRHEVLDQLRRLVDLEVDPEHRDRARPASRGCRRRCGTRTSRRRSARPSPSTRRALPIVLGRGVQREPRLVAIRRRRQARATYAAASPAGSSRGGSARRAGAGRVETVDAERPPVARARRPTRRGTSGGRR